MARKDELASRLSGGRTTRRPGWRDTISAGLPPVAAEPEPAETEATAETPAQKKKDARRAGKRHVRKTYILTPELVERIADLAEKERVAINELVRFLLTEALLQVENRELAIPTRPARRRINMEEF